MCALLGVRHAVSQAYHHRANGRLEITGQQLFERLRRIQIQEKISWVEALPQVLDRIHDTPGEGGLSPYEILFGRPRPLAGIPYTPPEGCEDAKAFFARMKKVDWALARVLSEKHAKRREWTNRSRQEPPPLAIMDKVWYLRPPDSGDKLDSRWIGPGLVTAREGEHSYAVEIKPGFVIKAHRSALKPYVPDEFSGAPIQLFFHKRTPENLEGAPDEWIVEKILGHFEKDGKLFFNVKWEGWEDPTPEPVGNFIHRYSAPWVRYCREHGVHVDVLGELSDTPMD